MKTEDSFFAQLYSSSKRGFGLCLEDIKLPIMLASEEDTNTKDTQEVNPL
jgi:hypothetical protein